ncbi:hypothetical protein AB4Z54_12780, partial [Streptomyces sp. MCAF7]
RTGTRAFFARLVPGARRRLGRGSGDSWCAGEERGRSRMAVVRGRRRACADAGAAAEQMAARAGGRAAVVAAGGARPGGYCA